MSLFIYICDSVYTCHSCVSLRTGQTPSSDSCSAPFSSSPSPHFDLLFTRWWHKAPRIWGVGNRGGRTRGDHLRATITESVQCTYLDTRAAGTRKQESQVNHLTMAAASAFTHMLTRINSQRQALLVCQGLGDDHLWAAIYTQIWPFFFKACRKVFLLSLTVKGKPGCVSSNSWKKKTLLANSLSVTQPVEEEERKQDIRRHQPF